MAKPGFRNHPKFKRLCHILDVPEPHALGYCELIWETGYACGNSRIGDSVDVELAAQWPGAKGALAQALADVRLLDVTEGVYSIHDLYDHAPGYVKDRRDREIERAKDKVCLNCGTTYKSDRSHSKFCTDKCRVAAHRNGTEREVTPALRQETFCNASPAQPSPNRRSNTLFDSNVTERLPCAENGEGDPPKGRTKITYPSSFERWWLAYPRRNGKQKAFSAWKRAGAILVARGMTKEQAAEHLLSVCQAFALSPKGQSGEFCPYPQKWLNEGRYDDDPKSWQEQRNARPNPNADRAAGQTYGGGGSLGSL